MRQGKDYEFSFFSLVPRVHDYGHDLRVHWLDVHDCDHDQLRYKNEKY